jgi:hypothetical protein
MKLKQSRNTAPIAGLDRPYQRCSKRTLNMTDADTKVRTSADLCKGLQDEGEVFEQALSFLGRSPQRFFNLG